MFGVSALCATVQHWTDPSCPSHMARHAVGSCGWRPGCHLDSIRSGPQACVHMRRTGARRLRTKRRNRSARAAPPTLHHASSADRPVAPEQGVALVLAHHQYIAAAPALACSLHVSSLTDASRRTQGNLPCQAKRSSHPLRVPLSSAMWAPVQVAQAELAAHFRGRDPDV